MSCTTAQVRAQLAGHPRGLTLEQLATALRVSTGDVYVRIHGMQQAGQVRWSTGRRRRRSPLRRILLTPSGLIDRRRPSNARRHAAIWAVIPPGVALSARQIAQRVGLTKEGVRKHLPRLIASGVVVVSQSRGNAFRYARGQRPQRDRNKPSLTASDLTAYLRSHPHCPTPALLQSGFGRSVLRRARAFGAVVATRHGLTLRWSLPGQVDPSTTVPTSLADRLQALLCEIGAGEHPTDQSRHSLARSRLLEPLIARGFVELRGSRICGYGLTDLTSGMVDPLQALRSLVASKPWTEAVLAEQRPRMFRRLEHAGLLDQAISLGLLIAG